MKSTKDFRNGSKSDSFNSDDMRRGTKLAPARKNGKERFSIYDDVDEDDGFVASKRESVFDYLDDDEA